MIAWHVQLMMTSCENECLKEKKKWMACRSVGVLEVEIPEEAAAGWYGKVLLGHEAEAAAAAAADKRSQWGKFNSA